MTTGDRSVPTHTHSTTHGQMPGSRYSRRLHRESWALRGMVAVSKAPGRACGRGGMGRHGRRTRRRLRLENAVTRIAGERASTRRQASATYIYIKDPGESMGGPCGFRIPMTRPVCARGAPKRRPSMHGANPFQTSESRHQDYGSAPKIPRGQKTIFGTQRFAPSN